MLDVLALGCTQSVHTLVLVDLDTPPPQVLRDELRMLNKSEIFQQDRYL